MKKQIKSPKAETPEGTTAVIAPVAVPPTNMSAALDAAMATTVVKTEKSEVPATVNRVDALLAAFDDPLRVAGEFDAKLTRDGFIAYLATLSTTELEFPFQDILEEAARVNGITNLADEATLITADERTAKVAAGEVSHSPAELTEQVTAVAARAEEHERIARIQEALDAEQSRQQEVEKPKPAVISYVLGWICGLLGLSRHHVAGPVQLILIASVGTALWVVIDQNKIVRESLRVEQNARYTVFGELAAARSASATASAEVKAIQAQAAADTAAKEAALVTSTALSAPIARTTKLNQYGPGVGTWRRWSVQHDQDSTVTHTVKPGSSEDKWVLESPKNKLKLSPGPDGKLVKIQ